MGQHQENRRDIGAAGHLPEDKSARMSGRRRPRCRGGLAIAISSCMTSIIRTLLAGAAGALTLTAVHEVGRRVSDRAPRMDILGMRAISRGLEAAGRRVPEDGALHRMALVGDVLSNSIYYALVGAGAARHPIRRGAVIGALAGVGALALPPRIGLGEPPASNDPVNKALTVAWYVIGGVAAGAAHRALAGARQGSTGRHMSA
jgi:hypothetical protein